MTRRSFLLAATVATTLALLVSRAEARSAVPVVEFKDQPIVTADGKPPSAQAVRAAIVRAAATLGWALAPDGEDRLIATLVVRNKHTIVTDVSWTPERYSVTYRSSVNMKAEVKDGVKYVHPFYNDWARKLVDEIRAELARG